MKHVRVDPRCADARMKLRGERRLNVLGRTITARKWRGPKPPKMGWLRGRMSIIEKNWHGMRDGVKPLFDLLIQDWDGLTYEDVWRDPEIGMALYRELTRG